MSRTILLLLLTGISSGMTTYLAAAGLSIVIAGMDLINFGAGAYYMMGAFLCYQIAQTGNFALGVIVVPLIIAGLGFISEWLLRRLYTGLPIYQLLMTLGLGYILQDVIAYIWGYRLYSVRLPRILRGYITILENNFPIYYVFMIVVGGIFAAVLLYIFYKTKIGIIFRAITSNRTMVNTLGINVTLAFSVMYMIAMWLTGLAGVLAAPTITITATDTLDIFVSTMVVLRIGGWKSLKGAFLASIVVGMVNSVGAMYFGTYYTVIPTAIMLIVLIVKPQGLFADKV